MRNKKLVSKVVIVVVLCAALALPAGCSGAQTSEGQGAQEVSQTSVEAAKAGQESAEPASPESGQEGTAQAEAANGQETAAGAEEEGAYAEIPPLEEITTDKYVQKSVLIYRDHLTNETAQLRFYSETPNVAFMGIGEYFDLMLGGGLKVEDNGDGTYTLTNAEGAKALVDTEKDTVTAADMPAFENYLKDAQEGKASSFKDSSATFLKLREVVYEGEPEPVEFDLGALGLDIEGDGEEIWFPLSVLTTWLTDIAQNIVTYNGNYLYICRVDSPEIIDENYYNTDYYNGILAGTEREKDLTNYSYGELGFIFRYMYGYPGRTELNPEILRNEGFDAALTAYGEAGAVLKEELTSRDFGEFFFGMYKLSSGPLEDGHNNTSLALGMQGLINETYQAFREKNWPKFDDLSLSEFQTNISDASMGVSDARSDDYFNTGYYKNGDTVILLLDSFNVDEDGWKAYFQNGGDIPDDAMGTAAKGLAKAAQEGDVKNVVFDLATNPGGYSDAAMGVLSLMTGRDYLCGYNELSKQKFKVYFDVDRNLDGEINEKDDELTYDFNYAVMTSRASFSCGNMFPFLVKDEGGIVIGDRSGGGSCSLQKAVLSEGFDIIISGYKFKLTNESGASLEEGVTPDIELEIGTKKGNNEFTGEETEVRDYSAFGDLDGICEAVSGWYAAK